MMKRQVAAALAFNVYAYAFVVSFWAATPLVFHGDQIERLRATGVTFKFEDWGFGEHYIWRLFAAIVSTALAALICGAIARQRGGKVALIANLPSVIGWLVYVVLFFFLYDWAGLADQMGAPPRVAYGVTSVIAIPITCWIALRFGNLGELVEGKSTEGTKTLGLATWHWAWLWITLSPYGYKIIANLMALVGMQLRMWNDRGLLGSLLSLLGLLVIAAWVAPLIIGYQTLSGKLLHGSTPTRRTAVVMAILVGGYALATGVAHVLGRILEGFGY